jgi:hypothetical protein
MLDHLTIIAKCAKDLKIDERYCGIVARFFWTFKKKTRGSRDSYKQTRDAFAADASTVIEALV